MPGIYATVVALGLVGVALLVFVVWLAGLPGRIAIARSDRMPKAST
jgi:hypothetical protein